MCMYQWHRKVCLNTELRTEQIQNQNSTTIIHGNESTQFQKIKRIRIMENSTNFLQLTHQ